MSLLGKPVPAPAQSLVDAQFSVNDLREARAAQMDPVAAILKEFEREVTLREHEEAQRAGYLQNMYAGQSLAYRKADVRAMAAEILRLREAQQKAATPEPAWQYGTGRNGREYRVLGWDHVELKRVALWHRTSEIPTEDVELVAALITKARQQEKQP